MVSLAAPSKPVGELFFSGGGADALVTVNGEPARSGRTLFGDSTISTGDGVQAIVSVGKLNRIQLAANSTFALSEEPGLVAGSLVAGNITVINSLEGVTVRNLAGELVKLNAGETVGTNASTAVRQTRTGGLQPWQWALIIGAAAAVIIIVAASGGDDAAPASPIR